MFVGTSGFANIWSQIKQIYIGALLVLYAIDQSTDEIYPRP